MANIQQFFELKNPNRILVAGQDQNGAMYYLYGFGHMEFLGMPLHTIMVHWDQEPTRTNEWPTINKELESG